MEVGMRLTMFDVLFTVALISLIIAAVITVLVILFQRREQKPVVSAVPPPEVSPPEVSPPEVSPIVVRDFPKEDFPPLLGGEDELTGPGDFVGFVEWNRANDAETGVESEPILQEVIPIDPETAARVRRRGGTPVSKVDIDDAPERIDGDAFIAGSGQSPERNRLDPW